MEPGRPVSDCGTGTSTVAPRTLPCVLVYSSSDHCPNVESWLDDIWDVLTAQSYAPKRLGDEIRSGKDYLGTLDQMLADCALGVVILDGLRPNVTFEFGWLKGLGKPVIILASTDACVNVKTLYPKGNRGGLSLNEYDRKLCNPRLDMKAQLSDFDGKHVAYFDHTAPVGARKRLKTVLAGELAKALPEVKAEVKRLQTKGLPFDIVDSVAGPLAEIGRIYYSAPDKIGAVRLARVLDSVRKATTGRVPVATLRLAAGAYLKRRGSLGSDSRAIIECLRAAAGVYDEMLSAAEVRQDPNLRAEGLFGIGYVSGELSRLTDKVANCRKSIASFEQALEVYTPDRLSIDFARTQNNLGIAYRTLAEVEDKAANSRKAIAAYERAIKVYTHDRFPMDFAGIQNNLGNVYCTLAEVKDKAANSRKAIVALKQALGEYDLDRFPMDYAMAQNNLGIAYRTLAEVKDKVANCRKAVAAYGQALGVHILARFPMEFGAIQNNLGIAYATLAEVKDKAPNCRKAIAAFEQALKVRTLARFPMDFATTQNNLGNAYCTLGEVKDKAANSRKAIVALEQALGEYDLDRFPMDYAMTQNNLGNAYRMRAEVDDKAANSRMALKAYEEARDVYRKLKISQPLKLVERNLAGLSDFLSEKVPDAKRQLAKPGELEEK
jgi:tetratricopeptide (TPR) repeat protein